MIILGLALGFTECTSAPAPEFAEVPEEVEAKQDTLPKPDRLQSLRYSHSTTRY